MTSKSKVLVLEKNFEVDAQGKPRSKSIKHAHFNAAWVMSP
jgi:hypothetical protein